MRRKPPSVSCPASPGPSAGNHIRLNVLPGISLSEVGAELGSPLLEFGQLGLQALDLAVDARQLGPRLLLIDITIAAGGPGEGLDLAAEQP
jgi:hypothetical protein